jgi:hypothetical protein
MREVTYIYYIPKLMLYVRIQGCAYPLYKHLKNTKLLETKKIILRN